MAPSFIELDNQVKRQAVAGSPDHCVDSNPHESFSCSLAGENDIRKCIDNNISPKYKSYNKMY